MEKGRIIFLLEQLDGSGSDKEYAAIRELRALGNTFPSLLLEKYRSEKTWQARSSCVYHAIRYSRDNDAAYTLGIEALSDKSKVVRYRACMLVAYALKRDALPVLRKLAASAKDEVTIENYHAAIDAIEHKNANYFVDRDHSGQVTLRIN